MINFIILMAIDEIKQEAPLQSSNLGETPPIALKSSQKKGLS